MARFNAKQSSLSKDAVVVTPGLIPCGCIIDSVALDSKAPPSPRSTCASIPCTDIVVLYPTNDRTVLMGESG